VGYKRSSREYDEKDEGGMVYEVNADWGAAGTKRLEQL
jgi:hypothetical protein